MQGQQPIFKGKGAVLGPKAAIRYLVFPQMPRESTALFISIWANNAWCVAFPQLFPIYIKSIIKL